MVDFKKMMEDSYARSTPEERARIDAYHEREARLDAESVQIVGHFEREVKIDAPAKPAYVVGGRRLPISRPPREESVTRTWEKPLKVRLEDRGDEGHESIVFHGAVTGYESYSVNEDFCRMLVDPAERAARPTFYICAGGGRDDACWVSIDDVVDYLRERRPHLFPDHEPAAPAPTPGGPSGV